MRSIRAVAVAGILRLSSKRKYSVSREKALSEFEKEKAAGEKPYELPRMKFRSAFSREERFGTDVLVFDGAKDLSEAANAGGETSTAAGAPLAKILYLHGGGYVHRPRSFHLKFCDRLAAATGRTVVLPLYPLAPFHRAEETIGAVWAIYADMAKDGPVVLMGDSAGGGMALGLYADAVRSGLPRPEQAIVFSPWVDLATDHPDIPKYARSDAMLVPSTARLWAEIWAGEENFGDFRVSPARFDRPEELTNVTLFTGTKEILYPDALRFFGRIEDNPGCRLIVGEKMDHVYPIYPIPEAKRAMRQVLELLDLVGTRA